MEKSASHSFLKEKIEREFVQLHKSIIEPWNFFHLEKGLEVTAFDGSKISYKGVRFGDNARLVFWANLAQPYLKDIASRIFAETRSFCKEHKLNCVVPLAEARDLLEEYIDQNFTRMVEIDRRLRGKGYPKSVEEYNPENEKADVLNFVEERHSSELALMPKENKLNAFYEKQKFWVWIIPIVLTLIGLAVKIFV